MSVRIYVSSPVRAASGAWSANAEQYMTQGHVSWIPSNEDGTPASPWVLSVGRAPGWAAANADADLRQLFPIPGTIDTREALVAYLRDTTVAAGSPAQQAALLALLDSLNVYRGDVILTVSLARVVRRVRAFLMEKDPGFADGWGG